MRRLLPVLLLCLLPGIAWALSFPALSGRVVDQAGIISQSEQQQLTAMLADHERQTHNQLVVVTLSSLQGEEIEEYGYQLGRHWGIGQKGKNNGALLIVAPKERAVRIEVGYGLEGVLTDALTQQIIQQDILPAFRQGNYAGGIRQGTQAIITALERKPYILNGSSDAQSEHSEMPTPVLILIIIIIILLAIFGKGGRGGGGWRGGGRRGGGGFRGGGGGFGGGGSSGRW